MGWTAGYASDVEYVAGFYAEQAPDLLSFACVLNGIEPIDTTRPFTYCELGFGRGLTVSLLAAANPHAQFHACDFNPAHVAGAQRLAKRAGLANLTLLENSFGDLADGEVTDLPQFDFVTLHGIYSWVNPEVRGQIVRFLKRYVKPGGIVYVSYNAMPGWAAGAPLQRLLYEYAQLQVRPAADNVRAGVAFTAELAQHQRGYFANNTALEARMKAVQTANPNYLVHEYMHPHWQALYHADVARELAEAKLDFAGRAELPINFDGMFIPQGARAHIDAVADGPFRETLKDYALNASFRKDVYVRGAQRMSAAAQKAWLKRYQISTLTRPERLRTEFTTSAGTVSGKRDMYLPVIEALLAGPRRLSDLGAIVPELQTTVGVLEAASLLAGSQQAALFQTRTQPSAKAAHALNRTLAEEARLSGDMLVGLAAPLTGSATSGGMIELLVYDALATGVPEELEAIAGHVQTVLRESGRNMSQHGKPVTDPAASLALVRNAAEQVMIHALPVWRVHGSL